MSSDSTPVPPLTKQFTSYSGLEAVWSETSHTLRSWLVRRVTTASRPLWNVLHRDILWAEAPFTVTATSGLRSAPDFTKETLNILSAIHLWEPCTCHSSKVTPQYCSLLTCSFSDRQPALNAEAVSDHVVSGRYMTIAPGKAPVSLNPALAPKLHIRNSRPFSTCIHWSPD